ncbi:MAG: LCP family protein [Candidatus Saccharimonadales bacterium]
MHNFKKNNSQPPRRTMDGFLSNAPGRQQQRGDIWPSKREAQAHAVSSGNVDDFKRAEGFHPTDRTQTEISIPDKNSKAAKAEKKAEGSLLHMTLPGGSLNRKDRKRLKNKKQDKWSKIRKWSFRTSLAVAGLVLILGGFLLFKGYLNLNRVFKGGGNAAALNDTVSPDQLRGEGDGRINVLLLGRGGEGHAGADLTDTILVASIDPVNKTAGIVSIPRDLWVTASGQGATKINAVFANAKNKALRSDKDKAKAEAAGVDALKKTVSDVLGLPIHYYTMIDFAGFKQAVDIVGGVDIDVPADLAVSEHLWDSTTHKPYYLQVPAGQQHFDSTKALYFARSRKTSPRGDFDRSERQRLFITALSQKVLSAGTYTNPVKITQLMDAFGSHVTTDFSVGDAVRLMQIAKEIPSNSIASIGLTDLPNPLAITATVDSQSVVVPKAGVGNYGPIQNFIRSKLPDGYIIKEAAKLKLLNGTTVPGMATTKADELKSYAYNVVIIGDAPTKTYDKTVLVDMTNNKPYTKNYLEKRFGVKAVSKLPDDTIQPEGADFVIILGSNER